MLDAIVVSADGYAIRETPVDIHNPGRLCYVPVFSGYDGTHRVQRDICRGKTGTDFVVYYISTADNALQCVFLFRVVPHARNAHWLLRSAQSIDIIDAAEVHM